MSKKKQPRNGFFYFMLDMQNEFRAQGRDVKIRDMSSLAGPRWARLGDGEKLRYSEIAKGKRGPSYAGCNPQTPPSDSAPNYKLGRMDAKGELLSERRDIAAEYEERRRLEQEKLRAIFGDGRRVILQKFYFVDVQTLCEISDKAGQSYLPCEIGVTEYSLSEGITRTMHHFINPGKIPLGYRFAAKQQSESTHEIPLEFDMAIGDYRYLLGHLEEFLNPEGKGDLPPVFAKREHALCVEWTLDWLAAKVGVANRVGGVWEVEGLMCELKAHAGGKLRHFQAEELLKTSAYDYDLDTRCGWHDDRGVKFCALATTKIYCYVLSECLCPLFSVSLTNAHLPKMAPPATVDVVTGRGRSGRGLGGGGRGPGGWTQQGSTTPMSMDGEGGVEQQLSTLYIARGRGRGQRYHHADSVRKPGGLASKDIT